MILEIVSVPITKQVTPSFSHAQRPILTSRYCITLSCPLLYKPAGSVNIRACCSSPCIRRRRGTPPGNQNSTGNTFPRRPALVYCHYAENMVHGMQISQLDPKSSRALKLTMLTPWCRKRRSKQLPTQTARKRRRSQPPNCASKKVCPRRYHPTEGTGANQSS